MKQYDAYTAFPAQKTTSAISEVKIDKCLQFQVNWLNIARDTTIKVQPKNLSQNFEFFIPSITLTLIYVYKTLFQLQYEHPYQHSRNTNGWNRARLLPQIQGEIPTATSGHLPDSPEVGPCSLPPCPFMNTFPCLVCAATVVIGVICSL